MANLAATTITGNLDLASGGVLSADKITPESGTTLTLGDSGDTFNIPSGVTLTNNGTATGFGGGKIGQVLQATRTAPQTFTLATGTLADIGGITLNITPSSITSKILVEYRIHLGRAATEAAPYSLLLRDGSIIFQGDAIGSRQRATSAFGTQPSTEVQVLQSQIFLDSPASTSALTYKIQVGGFNGRTFYVNQPDVNSVKMAMTTSTITAMEVLA